MILYDDEKTAIYKTGIEGWVSANGFFFGNNKDSEHLARYHGCTHVRCKDCGEPTLKGYIYCKKCQERHMFYRYIKKPLVEWDEKTPVYSDTFDKYFMDYEVLLDFIESDLNGDRSDRTLQLLLCKPAKLRSVEVDYWQDDLPDDYDLPDEIVNALDNLNEVLEKTDLDLWEPSNKRVSIESLW